MADNELVEQIKIEVKDAKTNINSLTKDLQNMQKVFDKISSVKFNASSLINQLKNIRKNLQLPKANVTFKGLTASLKSMADPFKYVSDRMKLLQSRINKYSTKIQKGQTIGKEDKQDIANIQAEARAISNNAYLKELAAQKSQDLKTQQDRLKQSTDSLKQAQDEQSQSTHKSASAWQKLLGRIKNIAIYRAIRTGLKWITSGFREGLDNLAQYSDGVNKTMSNLNGSLNQIKNTMGIAFASVLQALEPVITALADGLVEVVNSFNLAMAKMSGQNVYTKAKKNVDDYAKSLQKAQKFSFDTFNVLSSGDGQTSPKDMFEEEEVSKDESALSGIFESLINTAKTIFAELKNIWGAIQPLLKPLLESINSLIQPLSEIIISLLPLISDIITTVMPFLIEVIKGLSDILKQLGPIIIDVARTLLPPILNILKSVFSLIEALYPIFETLVNTMLPPIKAALDIIGGVIETLASAVEKISNFLGINKSREDRSWWQRLLGALFNPFDMLGEMGYWLGKLFGFADGGFTTANFIATNENGRREWVGRNANATAVVNDTQMSDIMYGAVRDGCYQGILQAIYESPNQSFDSRDIVLQIDGNTIGRAIASSRGFRQEMTRRNVGSTSFSSGVIR